MFGRDPEKALAKARRLLAGGDALAALRLAEKAQPRARPPLSGEIAAVAGEARRKVVAEAEARAETSAAEGYFEDAAEWLRGALGHADGTGDGERERLAARIAELEERAEEAAAAAEREAARAALSLSETEEDEADDDREDAAAAAGGATLGRPGLESILGAGPRIPSPDAGADAAAATAVGDGPDPDPDLERQLYEAFVDSLRDDVAPGYRDRPPEFRRALLDLAEQGDADASQAAIEAMAEADPDDPVLRLERGRWRLSRGQAAAARADLEAAWEAFGDQPLDLGGVISIPEMWCEAALAGGDAAAVLERLEARGELTMSDPELSLYYAQALLTAGEAEEASRFLAESLAQFPRRTDLAYLLAATLHRGGDAEGAIGVLEGSIRACGPGCSASSLHPPSLRLLAGLYAERGGPAERLGDLLQLLRGAQGGELAPGDWMLQARYHELTGEPALAERARERAGRMLAVEAPEEGPPPAPAYEEA